MKLIFFFNFVSFDWKDSVGPDNIGGFDKVEALASYLVSLVPADNTAISLTNDQATKVISLWNQLDQYDKRPTKFSPRHRTKASGRFKATKKRQSIVVPEVESTKR